MAKTSREALEIAKRGSTVQVLFKVARLLDERALSRVAERQGGKPLRRSHTSLLPHIALEGGTRITELADKLGITKQAVSQLVDDLEERGVVARTADPDDARAKLVVYTDKGKLGIMEGLAVLREIEGELEEWVGKAQMQRLHEALLVIHDRLGDDQ